MLHFHLIKEDTSQLILLQAISKKNEDRSALLNTENWKSDSVLPNTIDVSTRLQQWVSP